MGAFWRWALEQSAATAKVAAMSTRLHWILALVLALGPASLRLVHGATAHGEHPTAACGHDHEGDDGDSQPSKPTTEHHCGVCDELASLTPGFSTPVAAPIVAPRCVAVIAPSRAHAPATIVAPRICRGQPPPQV